MDKQHEAEIAYNDAILRDPGNAQWRIGRGIVLLAGGDTAGAVSACDEALQLDPNLEAASYNRGLANEEAQEYDEALADFSRAVRLNPVFAQAYNGRGVVLARTGRLGMW